LSFRGLLQEFASRYPDARKEPFRGHEVSILMRKTIAAEIEALGLFESDQYRVSGSVGKGGWAEIPWVAVYKLSETDTLHHGFFIVYVFSANLLKLYLTVNQGSVLYFETHTRAETNAHIRGSSDAVIANMDSGGFASGPIDLGTKSNVGRFLENGCMFSLEYDVASLPTDDILFSDLKKAKELYLEALDTKARLSL
jgi:5-methylcytosine-specific restriction protein A